MSVAVRYAFAPPKPPANGFTIHEKSGAAMLFWLLALLTPLEAAAMHFILPRTIAWILTALTLYSALWMIAVARSVSALPIVVGTEISSLQRAGRDHR